MDTSGEYPHLEQQHGGRRTTERHRMKIVEHNKFFGAARNGQTHQKIADFEDPLPSTTFFNASNVAVNSD